MGHALPLRAVKGCLSDGQRLHTVHSKLDCTPCVRRMDARRFSGSLTSVTKVRRLLCDTKGKIETKSVDGHHYWINVVEEYSRYVHVCTLRSRSNDSDKLLQFVRHFEKQTGHTVNSVHTDDSAELKPAVIKLDNDGISVTITTLYRPESNGLAEQTHAVNISHKRTCLQVSKLSQGLWHHAIRHVDDARNAIKRLLS